MKPSPLHLALVLALISASTIHSQDPLSARDSARHVLNRLAWGPQPGEIEKISRSGIRNWIDSQLQPQTPADQALEASLITRYQVLSIGQSQLVRLFTTQLAEQAARARQVGDTTIRRPAEARGGRNQLQELLSGYQLVTLERIVNSENQLAEVMVDFWVNHFNVFQGKGLVRAYLPSYVETAIRPNALGKFEDLLIATARHPAMLFYLDNAQSVAAGAVPPELARLERARNLARRPGARQTPARARADSNLQRLQQRRPTGLNENYARELLELHTLGVDGGYTQTDVIEVARILTGWGINRPNLGGEFIFNAWAHDRGAKTVLGVPFPSGQGEEEGIRLLEMLANHPSTMHHVSAKICARLVADSPPDGCIDDAVRAWRKSGGEIREVVRAVILSPDFWAPTNLGTKIKTPLEFVASALRATGAEITDPRLLGSLARLGQPLYGQTAPTGWPETQEDWVNSGALLQRMTISTALAAGRLPGTALDLDRYFPTGPNSFDIIDQIDDLLFGKVLSDNSKRTIRDELLTLNNPRASRATALGLALGGPEFQRQ